MISTPPPPVSGPITAFRTDTAHSGTYAARLTTNQFGSIIVPGFIGTGDVDLPNTTIHLGRPYTQRPDRFTAWFKYAPVAGDSAAFEVYFKQAGTIIGTAKQVIKSPVSSWTNIDMNINWTGAGNPDSVVIIGAASAAYNLVNVTMSQGRVGSTLWVDDMSLEFGGVGVEEVISNNVSIYPNPAVNTININTTELPSGLVLNIFDASGKKVLSRMLTTSNEMVDVSALMTGTYVLVVQDNMSLVHRSKLIKQ